MRTRVREIPLTKFCTSPPNRLWTLIRWGRSGDLSARRGRHRQVVSLPQRRCPRPIPLRCQDRPSKCITSTFHFDFFTIPSLIAASAVSHPAHQTAPFASRVRLRVKPIPISIIPACRPSVHLRVCTSIKTTIHVCECFRRRDEVHQAVAVSSKRGARAPTFEAWSDLAVLSFCLSSFLSPPLHYQIWSAPLPPS